MKTLKIVILMVLSFLLLLVTACGGLAKQTDKQTAKAEKKVNFPTKEITWIVPVSAGGQFDAISRIAAEYFKKNLPNNVPIVIKNAPGADWALGLGQFTNSKPDGHTVSVFNIPANAINQIKGSAPYDLNKVEWIGRLTSYPLVGLVKKGSKYQKIDDFKNAKNFKAGTVGLTSGIGLSTIATIEEFGIKEAKIIPHNGTSEAITALLRGDVDYIASSIGSVFDLIKKGDVIPMWVFSEEKVSLLPDVPTIKELGYSQLIVSSNPHTSIGLPPGTPAEIVKIWKDAFEKTIKDPEFEKKLLENLKSPLLPANAESEKKFVQDGFKAMESILKSVSKYE